MENTNIREVVLDMLIVTSKEKTPSHLLLNQALEKYQYLTKQERSFISRLYRGSLEHRIRLDYIIEQFSSVKVKKMKPLIRSLLRMSVYQFEAFNSVPASAVCNEAVKLAKKRGFKSLAGFVNGVLRNIHRGLDSINYPSKETDFLSYISINYSIPMWILELWKEQLSDEQIEQIASSFAEQKGTVIRCNTQKISPKELTKRLEAEGITVCKGHYFEEALIISGYDYLKDIRAFNEGLFVVQDESSMVVAHASKDQKIQKVIDVCSAPGGKSLHLSLLLENDAKIFARDLTPQKVMKINENVWRLGVSNIEAEVKDATFLYEEDIETADVVIADVPCSGLGVLGKKPDIRFNMSSEQIEELVELQRKILSTVYQYVKDGGLLIFSTCTINRQENEENVEWLLNQFPLELESLENYLPKALWQDNRKDYLQLLSGIHQTDGFFIARFRKKK